MPLINLVNKFYNPNLQPLWTFIQSLQKEIYELKSQSTEKNKEINSLQKQIHIHEKNNLQVILTKKEQELVEAKETIITTNNLEEDDQEELDDLLEEQKNLTNLQLKKESEQFIAYAEKQLNKTKKRLSKIITQEEISLLSRLQIETTTLKGEEQELVTKIELPPK